MTKLPSGSIWAIWIQAWHQLQAQLAIALSDVSAGAADDAERFGLPIQKHGNVAVVSLEGPMVKNAGFLRFFGFAGSKETQRAIEAAASDDDIETILLNIDSPGGSVDGLAELTDATAAAAREKTVIAQVSGMAASAAFMVASQASKIFAGRMDLIGSIGTRMLLFDLSKMFEEAGIKAIPVDTGKFKSAGALGTEITDEQIADFQRIVDAFFDDFVAAVANGRSMSEKKVREVGDGRIFLAREAIEIGLIDGIQSFDETFTQNIKMARPARTGRRNETRLREQQL